MCLATVLVIAGTLGVDLVHPAERPKLQGREAVKDQKLRASARLLDGSWARLQEYDYRLTSRVRDVAAQPYTNFLFRYLDENSSAVLIGSEDWLFLERRVEWPREGGDIGIRRTAALEAALGIRARALGTRIVWMHIPRKAVIERARLPRGYDSGVEFERQMVPLLRERGVDVIDLLPAFERMGAEPAYRKIDTHWSSFGMTLAAQETARQGGVLVAPGDERGKLVRVENKGPTGALLRTLGVTPTEADLSLEPSHKIRFRLPDRGATRADGSAPFTVCGTSFSSIELGRVLGHYMGQPVQRFANEGGTPYDKLGAVFRNRLDDNNPSTTLPELMVVDVPNHIPMLLSRKARSWVIEGTAARWLAAYAPSRVYPMEALTPKVAPEFDKGSLVALRGGRTICHWPSGAIPHSGEGLVAFELDLELMDASAAARLLGPDSQLSIPLKPGRHRLVLPLISPYPGATPGRLTVRIDEPGGSVRVHECRVVSTLETKLVASAPQGTESQWIEPQAWPSVEPATACLIRFQPSEGPAFAARVRVESASGTAQTFDFPRLQRSTPLVVTPGILRGESVSRVTVEPLPGAAGGLPAIQAVEWLALGSQ